MELITQQAMKAGFTGGVVIDYPNSTKAKKLAHCMLSPILNISCSKYCDIYAPLLCILYVHARCLSAIKILFVIIS